MAFVTKECIEPFVDFYATKAESSETFYSPTTFFFRQKDAKILMEIFVKIG